MTYNPALIPLAIITAIVIGIWWLFSRKPSQPKGTKRQSSGNWRRDKIYRNEQEILRLQRQMERLRDENARLRRTV